MKDTIIKIKHCYKKYRPNILSFCFIACFTNNNKNFRFVRPNKSLCIVVYIIMLAEIFN